MSRASIARSEQAEVGTVFATMPETAVDEDDGVMFRKNDVRLSGERPVFRAIHGESIAEAVEDLSQGEFRLRVPAPDPGHDLGAFFGGEDVRHPCRMEHRTSNVQHGTLKEEGR